MRLSEQVDLVVRGLERENPELSRALKKWTYFLVGTAKSVADKTGREDEEVLGEILLGLVKVNEYYQNNIYRYEGTVYKIIEFDGVAVKIQTLDSNTKLHKTMWTHYKNIEEIKKTKLESYVYREIVQQYNDLITASYNVRRGYTRELCEEEQLVVKRSGHVKEIVKKKVYEVRKDVFLVDIDFNDKAKSDDASMYPREDEILRYLQDHGGNPEQNVIVDDLIDNISENLSNDALTVLGFLLSDTGVTERNIVKMTGMNERRVSEAKAEIRRKYKRFAHAC